MVAGPGIYVIYVISIELENNSDGNVEIILERR
jgi:hypothetical protein